MNKQVIAIGLLAAFGSTQAADLFNNGAAVAGTPPISVIRAGGTLYGAGAQSSIPNLVAEDFSVTGLGWNVESLSFFSYQSGSGGTFTFSSVSWSIVSGDVNTGSVIASGMTSASNGGLQGYRVTATTLGDTARPIFRINLDVTDFILPAGDYFLRWGLAGSTALTGPWQPPTASGVVGNGLQSLAGGAFATVIDAGDGFGIEMPFIIQGNLVPEPGTWALMIAGGLAVVGAARRREQRKG